jgi:hypothetical protein
VGFNKQNEWVTRNWSRHDFHTMPISYTELGQGRAYPKHKLSADRMTHIFQGKRRENTCAEEGSLDPLHVHVVEQQ